MKAKSLAASILSAGIMLAVSTVPAFADGTGYAPSGSSSGSTDATGGFSTVLAAQSISSSGGTITTSSGGSNVSLSIPQGAFSSSEQITLTNGNASSLSTITPTNDTVVSAFGVNFTGATPNVPITLTIVNSGIPSGAKVYKVNGNTLVPVPATVTAGKAVISFTTDPDFVVLAPKTNVVPNGTSPVTGVPIEDLLVGGIALVLLGGATMVLSRRNQAK